ncbi:YraN family protein [bacterium]|nr:YraN family protein [bacterium]
MPCAKGHQQRVGKRGEDAAADYLSARGYRILERNYRTRLGEIDIIAQKDHVLVFLEVKTQASDAFGPPETWVDIRKQKKIIQAASCYIRESHGSGMDCRFDVIAVRLGRSGPVCRHIRNAFWLG